MLPEAKLDSPRPPERPGRERARAGGAKRPESVLVVVYTQTGKVLLLRRADDPCFWQSITGSMRWDESTALQAARRELHEDTGLVPLRPLRDLGVTFHYPILPLWRHRYAPGTVENVEHVFGRSRRPASRGTRTSLYIALELPVESDITVNAAEHAEYVWIPFSEAATRVASWTNREAILTLAKS